MIAYVIIGPSGAGKTTLARELATLHLEADQHFVGADGVYRFSPSDLPAAHAQCLRRWVEALQGQGPPLSVSNTCTTIAEIAPYVATAQAYGADVRVIRLGAGMTAAQLAARNIHGLPAGAIQGQINRMADAMIQWPRHWPRVDERG